MNKFMSTAACVLLAGVLTACSGGTGSSSAPAAGAVSSSSASENSSQSTVQGEGEMQIAEMEVFVQPNSGAEEGYEPTIRLMENGRAEFAAYCYDGVVLLEGAYEALGEEYLFTLDEASRKIPIVGEETTELRLKKVEGGITYAGKEIGVTADGAFFEKK